MFKFMPLVRPPAGKTAAESHYHLRYHHSRLCATLPDFNRHMPKYVHNYVLSELGERSAELATDYTSVAECVYFSEDGFWDGQAEPTCAMLREDEQRFAAFDGLLLVAAAPVFVFGPGEEPPFKIWRFTRYRDGVDSTDARKFWEVTYAAAVARDERLRPMVTSYVQDRPARGFSHNYPVSATSDATDEFWIGSVDVVPEFLEIERELREGLGYDRYFDVERETKFVAETKVVWDVREDPRAALTRVKPWPRSVVV